MSHRSFINSFPGITSVALCVCVVVVAFVGSSFVEAWSATKNEAGADQLSAMDLTPPFSLTNPARIAAGKELFSSSCATYCHGRNPPLFVGRKDLNAKFVFVAIYTGGIGKNKPMPAWGHILSKKEIWELVAYLKSLGDW